MKMTNRTICQSLTLAAVRGPSLLTRSAQYILFSLILILAGCGGGTSGGSTQQQQPLFTIQASPQTPLVLLGGSAGVTLPVLNLAHSTFTGNVNVTIGGMPTGLAVSPASATVQVGSDLSITLTASSAMATGAYPVTISGTGGGAIQSVTMTVGVQAPIQAATMQTPTALLTGLGQGGGSLLVSDSLGDLFGIGSGSTPYGAVVEFTQFAGQWQQSILYSFTGGADGYNPVGPLVLDAAGNIYGVTSLGGVSKDCAEGCGVVFELTRSTGWQETVLYNFTGGSDGEQPGSGLVIDQAGNLYGTTTYGGSSDQSCAPTGCGTVFELSPSAGSWAYSTIYTFQSDLDAAYPQSALVIDSKGNLYGTTQGGGNTSCLEDGGCGTVFELSPSGSSWLESVLYRFQGGTDGARPGGLVLDASGNLFGTTPYGGFSALQCQNGFPCGNFYELSPSANTWSFTSLFNFIGNETGYQPASLLRDAAGNFYGTAQGGSTSCDPIFGCGMVFELSQTNGTWTESAIYDFAGGSGLWGPGPLSLMGGSLYGVASDGSTGFNTLFEMSP